jgi:putative ABC transport system permease protein
VVTLNTSLPGTRYEANKAEAQYYRRALERLRAIPGVKSAGAAMFVPLVQNMYMGQQFSLDEAHTVPSVLTTSISPDYFRTMGTRLLEGREFSATDRAGAEAVVMVNKSFADSLGVGERIVGLKITGWRGRAYTIAGVVADERLTGPSWTPVPQAYFPLDQSTPGFATFVARIEGDTKAYLAMCRDALKQVDPRIPIYDVKTLDERLVDNLARPRFYTTAIVFFAGFALLLAVTGVYGLASYGIAQRTHEIGVRMAVGAGTGRVRFMLLRQGMLPLAIGLTIGAAGALACSHSLRALIADAPSLDGRICGEAALTLVAAAASAIWIATRSIARMDPIRSIRAD